MKHTIPHTIAGLVAAGVLLAGCGGGSSNGSPSQAAVTGSPSSSKLGQQALAFASCMRSHGVSNYPDPAVSGSGDRVQIRISPGTANPNSPAFKSAESACQHLLPGDGAPEKIATAQANVQEVKFADCMRAHGVSNFPDPSHDGAFDLPPGLNPQAPQFNQAQQACKSVQPSSLSVNQSTGT